MTLALDSCQPLVRHSARTGLKHMLDHDYDQADEPPQAGTECRAGTQILL
jgi:hypothetical protein